MDYNLLLQYGAVIRRHKKEEVIIKEGGKARFFFVVYSGEIKMYNTGDDGQEFIQGIFKEGESFGEPPLFLDTDYPASAKALVDSEVLVLEKNRMINLLKDHFELHLQFTEILSRRLYFKSMMAREMTMHDAAHRILAVIDFLKIRDEFIDKIYPVSLTRQQLADLTGLRVETVIRSIAHLVKKGELLQKGRKVYR